MFQAAGSLLGNHRLATIRDVAKLAGVGLGTASRALNGGELVAEATRIAVEKAARKLNFQPSSTARALSTRKTNMLGVLTPRFGGHYFGTALQVAERTIRHAGKHILIASSVDRDAEVWADLEGLTFLRKQECDGILLLDSEMSERELVVFSEQYPAVAVVNRDLPTLVDHCFSIDHRDAGRQVAQYLASRGHRRLATITGPMRLEDARLRHEGFVQGLKEAGLALDPRLTIEGSYLNESGTSGAAALMATGLEFTALFCGNDEMAIAAKAVLTSGGVDPEIFGYDDLDIIRYGNLGISSVSVPVAEVVANACTFLLNRCYGGNEPVEHRFVARLAHH